MVSRCTLRPGILRRCSCRLRSACIFLNAAWILFLVACCLLGLALLMVFTENNGGRTLPNTNHNNELEEVVDGRLLLQKSLPMSTDVSNNEPLSSVTDLASIENSLKLEPNIDRTPYPSEDEIVNRIQKLLPSLPISYWNQYNNKLNRPKQDAKCGQYPHILQIKYSNTYWQTLDTSNGTFQLYSAYYDVRKLVENGPCVRIIGMINRLAPIIKTNCQFWFENRRNPIIVNVLEYKYMSLQKWQNHYLHGVYQPYLITCKIPRRYHNQIPVSVSLVENACDTATNNLRVIYNKPEKKKDFAVCVKGLDFLHIDKSVRLIEWIELLLIFGVDKIFMYELDIHPNISKVINYYQKIGKVISTPHTLQDGPNLPDLQHFFLATHMEYALQDELILYNDCLYKNMYTYKYIALLDIDEIIMPLNTTSWAELLPKVVKKAFAAGNTTCAAYSAGHFYFLDDMLGSHDTMPEIPKYMHMLRHVQRSKQFLLDYFVKSIFNPERVLIIQNHIPVACLNSNCSTCLIDTQDAQLHHYREDCRFTVKNCNVYRKNATTDITIWKFKDKLINKTTETLKKLKFL